MIMTCELNREETSVRALINSSCATMMIKHMSVHYYENKVGNLEADCAPIASFATKNMFFKDWPPPPAPTNRKWISRGE